MKNRKRLELPPVVAVLLSIISVQGGAAIAKRIFPVLGPAATSSLRIVLAAIILLVFNRPDFKNIPAKHWRYIALYGISLGAMNLVFYFAIARIPLALGVALEFIGPLVLALVSSKRMIDFLWVALAATGIALITPWRNNGLDVLGILLALIAGGFWVAYILLGGIVSKLMDGGKAVSIGMMFASVVVLPFAIGGGLLHNITPWILLSGLFLALLSSAIPFTLEMNALRKIPAKTFSILMSLEPAAAALSGLIFLHEFLTLSQWISITLIIVASVGVTLTARKNAVTPES